MAEEQDNKLEQSKDLLRNRKPCFEVTNSKIFVNLHNAACIKAAEVLKINPQDPNINQFVINTGISTDGRSVSDKIDAKNSAEVGKAFSINGQKYEMGIVLQFTDFKSPTKQDIEDLGHGDIWKAILKKNEKELKAYKEHIYRGIQEYFKWFAGIDIDINDLVEFIPDYNGGKIELNGSEIKSMTEEDRNNYMMHRVTDDSLKESLLYEEQKILNKIFEKDNNQQNTQNNKEIGSKFIPRLGYKVGYTIIFK